MTGTEMFDAIAHIDEDLIEGCLARMKARASERRALAAAEALTENEKKSSPFKRAALTFGAIAAAVVIMLGLISILHIGGKSPQPVGPVVTDSPAPTESATEAPTEEPTPILTPVDTFAEEILSVPVKWYSYDELFANPALGNEMTYLESIEDMEMVHYSPDAFLITDDGEIAIVDTVGARLCVYDLASGQLKKSVQVGQILEADPVRAAKYGGVYYVLIPYSDSRIVAVYPDGTTSEIPVPQLQGMLEYCRVSEYYAEDGRLILTLIGPDLIMTKAVSLSDGSVTSLYSTQWTLENDTFTVTRNGMIWSFPAEPSSGVRSTRIDVLKVGENGELYVIQEVPIEGQDDMGLYQIYDKDGRLLRCEKIDYFMDSYMTADGGRIVGPDDHLYEMHCDEDAVRIIRIVPAEPTEAPTPAPTAMPERPGENTNIPRVIAGEDVFFIVKPDGALYAWGNNEFGQLGVGDTENRTEPVLAANGLVPVVVGDTVFALSEDNILWGWGRNNCGQLGTGDLENRLRPVELMHFVKTAVKGRDSFYALTENGEVYKWGVDPMLNNIIDIDHSTIWEPELLFDNVTYFDGDYAIKQNGELWQKRDGDWRLIANEVRRVWHDRDTIAMEGTDGRLYTLGNREGIIGEPDEGRRLVAENFRSVVVSEGTIWVLTDDGSLYSYMAAYSNLLSHVSETDFDKLTFVMNEVVEFAADSYMDEDWGFDYKFALKANGELWAWGVYPEPSLGKTQMSDPNEPECVARGVRSITSTGAQTYIICEDGSLWASGIGPEAIPVFGSLGDGTTATRYGFVSLEAEGFCTVTSVMRTEYVSFDDETDSVALYCRTFAVDAEGTVFAWGWNGDGLLGVNSADEEVLTPTEVFPTKMIDAEG